MIHFLPLHPTLVYRALNEVKGNINQDTKFYKIPITNLINNKNAIYIYGKDDYLGPDAEMNEQTIQLLDMNNYEELSEIPLDTISYFKEKHKKGERFGIFQFIPHVFS
ncbi:hypothetical protein SAMN04487943_1213 [Gracilibacillus orientalis]|uniref:Uncharacterized protein n=1 Tax=Gracilibacillus orientalis TaxID=334253 RepID=A0A1I4R6B7_9BACI|nr:hypothetical protein [Gracilibacillus orientalis]SFM47536.1 hypothetical protein SAMN04487943_1213 [Gracilibacillus orientalis]